MEIWFESFVGSLGKLWRQNRRRLTPGIRDAFAQLLLEVRLEFLPAAHLDLQSNIGRARFDVRGITELLKHIASRQGPPTQCRSYNKTPKVVRFETHVVQPCATASKYSANTSSGSPSSAYELVGAWAPLPDHTVRVDDRRSQEVITLKRDIGYLQAEVDRMTANHHNEMANLRHKLQDSEHVITQGMNTLTAQMAEQAESLAKACRAMPTDAPV